MKTRVGLIGLLWCLTMAVQAQEWKQLNVDDLFTKARKVAFDGNREEARAMLHEVLLRAPDYAEVRTFLARTWAWDGQREKARGELRIVLEKSPSDEDALNALVDVEMWDEKYEQALTVVNTVLHHYPNEQDLIYKKASILSHLDRKNEASIQIARLLALNPAHSKGVSLMREIKNSSQKFNAGIYTSFDFFSRSYTPAFYLSPQISGTFGWGSAILRLNYSHRFNSNGAQPEIDIYPRIANGVYAYVNYGYAENALFPYHRVGGEIYTKLPKSFEASLGARFLDFGSHNKVNIYTGSVGWYVKNLWISYRPYFTPGGTGTSFSSVITVRTYFEDGENYLGISGGIGFSPDERRIQSSSGLSTDGIYVLKSQRFGLNWQKTLPHNLIINVNFGVARQELSFDKGNYVWITSPVIGLRKRF